MGSSPSPIVSVVEALVLTLWLGASLLFAAVVAPALFAVLPSRTLAGDVVGRVLPVLLYSGVVVSVLAGGRELMIGSRTGTLAGAAAAVACGYALALGRRIDRVRDAIGGPVDSLAIADPRRVEFGRLHGFSVGLLGAAMLAVLLLIVMLARRLAAPNAYDSL